MGWSGLDKVEKDGSELRTHEERLQDRINKYAHDVARWYQKDLERRAPKDTGYMSQNFSMEVSPAGRFAYKIRPDNAAPYTDLVIRGTKRHYIYAAEGRRLFFMKNGSLYVAKKVFHPGTKKNDFNRRAYRVAEQIAKDLLDGVAEDLFKL